MKDQGKQISAFKDWYDATWLGDKEHGQEVPLHVGDKRYSEYMTGYTLALGAWIQATMQERDRTGKAIESLTRADYQPANIWRHYYPSANGDWVCLRELRKALGHNAQGQRGAACGASAAPTGYTARD